LTRKPRKPCQVTAFLNGDRWRGHRRCQRRRPRPLPVALRHGLALARNYDPFKSPTHFKLVDLLQKFDKTFGATGRNYGKYGKVSIRHDHRHRAPPPDRWNFLFIAGMWFQDLFNYDFRRTEQCIIPYATQEGEISFCAYNTGIGWRNIIEKMHMTATLTKWYEEHGRHEIFAGNKHVPLP
jgi:7,8-dihydro-6-hydroxymethylpterin dimethyltransferase